MKLGYIRSVHTACFDFADRFRIYMLVVYADTWYNRCIGTSLPSCSAIVRLYDIP